MLGPNYQHVQLWHTRDFKAHTLVLHRSVGYRSAHPSLSLPPGITVSRCLVDQLHVTLQGSRSLSPAITLLYGIAVILT
jgi:hypothetical protein